MHPKEPLGRHISPVLDETRLGGQRAAIAARTSTRPRGRPWGIAALAGTAVLLGLFWLHHVRTVPVEGKAASALAEASTKGEEITLPDGSRIAFDPQSKASLSAVTADRVRVELERGGAAFDVAHVEGRPFIVVARGYEVRVLGTQFTVRLSPSPETLEVKVTRGKVRVTRAHDEASTRVLDAGETWSIDLGRSAVEPEVPVETAAPPAPPLPSEAPAPSAAPVPSHMADGPKELLARAERARAAHRSLDEAAALNTLRLRYRSDPRAGLAAFELGRLRLETLRDPAGAVEAFADAIALGPGAPFREDAEARRIEALEAMGDKRRCIEARSAYLSRYPDGLHRASVSSACSAP